MGENAPTNTASETNHEKKRFRSSPSTSGDDLPDDKLFFFTLRCPLVRHHHHDGVTPMFLCKRTRGLFVRGFTVVPPRFSLSESKDGFRKKTFRVLRRLAMQKKMAKRVEDEMRLVLRR